MHHPPRNVGSHAYGTSLLTSDRDVRGVMVAPCDYILDMLHIEQYQEKSLAATPERPDFCIYELRKYLALAADANSNILEIVFVNDSDVLRSDELIAWARKMDDGTAALEACSPLPKRPDRDAINALCVELVEEELARRSSSCASTTTPRRS